MTRIKTVYSEKYTAQTSTASMRKLGLVADEARKLGYAEILEPRDCEIVAMLKMLHAPEYVDAFVEGRDGWLASSQGWAWTPEIRDGVLEINKGQLTAAEIALEEGVAANVAPQHAFVPTADGGFLKRRLPMQQLQFLQQVPAQRRGEKTCADVPAAFHQSIDQGG